MSNTSKLYGFIGGIILLILLAIVFAIRPTFTIYNDISELNDKLKINGNLDSEIQHLEEILKPLNTNGNQVEWSDYNQFALAAITKSTSENKVRIIQFQPTLSKDYEDYRANLFQIELEGSYIRLLKTLKQLEHNTELGEIISSKLYIHKERKTKSESVHLIVYLQRLEQHVQ